MKRIIWALLIACVSFPLVAKEKQKKVYLNTQMHIISTPDKYGIYAYLNYDNEHLNAHVYNSRNELVYKLQLSALTKDTCVYDGLQEHYFFGELRDMYRYSDNVQTEHTYFRDGRPIFREPLLVGDTIWYYYRTICFREEASAYSVVEQVDTVKGIVKVKKYRLPSHELLEEFTYSKLSYKWCKYKGMQFEYHQGKKRYAYNYNNEGQLVNEYMLDTLGKVIYSASFAKPIGDSTVYTRRYNEMNFYYPDGGLRAMKSRNNEGEVEVQYFLPDGSPSAGSTLDDLPSIEHDSDYAYYNAEQNPVFPGGEEALRNYLLTNWIYPPKAKEKGITGKVVVSFTVETDGSISEVVVLHPLHKLLNDEAVRVVRSMPNWIPGKIDGKVVRVRRELPLNFTY